MLLTRLKENESAVIEKINASKAQRERLAELGIREGQIITCKNIALLGSPIAYEICGGKQALRKSDAERIEVSKIEG